MSLNLWPTEAKQLRKTKAENLKKRFKHVSSLAFFSSHFLHIFVVVVALLNLRPKDTISIWGACESLASAPRLHFISLSALWQGALISAWMQSKRFPFGPRERLPSLACWLVLTWSWPSEAQDKRHCHTFGWLAPREWPRGNLFNLINFHNLSWWAPKFPANNGKKALSTRPTWSCCQSVPQSVSQPFTQSGSLAVGQFATLWFNFFIALVVCCGRELSWARTQLELFRECVVIR